jgi:uncharacterized protein YcfJ
MKIKVLFTSLVLSSAAIAQEATVIDVQPIYRTVHSTESVPQVVEQCQSSNRGTMGLIEGTTSGVFGSTGGALGAGVGWIVGDAIGGSGATREIARVAGTIVGNSVGNNMSQSSNRINCQYRKVYVTRDVVRTVSDGYRVRVEAYGAQYVVHRSFAPAIGSRIDVVPQGFN